MKKHAMVWMGLLYLVMQGSALADDADREITVLGVAGLILPVLYFMPTIVGFVRKKGNKMAILVLNLFLGCSLIGCTEWNSSNN